MVNLNGQDKLWGMSWSAFNILVKILGDESTNWKGAEVEFIRQPVKTNRGTFPTLVAKVLRGNIGFQAFKEQAGATTETYISDLKEIKDKVQPERQENIFLYECPAKCGFKTEDPKKLGAHVAYCEEMKSMPSSRLRSSQ